MNDETLKELLLILKAIASNNPPGWQRPLKSYHHFDWSRIGATVVSQDQHGTTKVAWCGHIYTRRAGENKKFGAAIWFSRAVGGEDETNYLRLITFKDSAEAEPLPEYIAKVVLK